MTTPSQPPPEGSAPNRAEELAQWAEKEFRFHQRMEAFSLADKYAQVACVLRAQQAELLAFRADKQRLDWLIERDAFLSHSRDGEVCTLWYREYDEEDSVDRPVEGYPLKCYLTPRKAIDAAMALNSPTQGAK